MSDEASRSQPARLVTPAERDAAVARLSAAFARDVLTMAQYEERVTQVYRATTAAALADVTADLPGTAVNVVRPDERSLGPAVDASPQMLALFSNIERSGRIAVPPRLSIQAIFGNVELDLRDAEFRTGVTDIEASAFFGNVEVLLPPGATVENHGNAFLGNYAANAPGRPSIGEPSIHIRVNGMSIFGNVEFRIAGPTTEVRKR